MLGCVLATLGGLCLLLSAEGRNEALAPGDLSVQHAQLLQRGEVTKRCASCHAAADQSFGQWLQHIVNDDLALPTQTDLCLECHQKQIAKQTAKWAHNIDPLVLLANSPPPTPFQRRVDPTQELACATCHREHHGAAHDLTLMSDNACQACHQQQIHSFATDHPEFKNWPTRRRTQIAFDHGAHQLKHFPKENGPKEKLEFACATCHKQDRNGAFQRTLDYESTCAKCHESKIEASWDSGIAMFSLPMIEVETLSAAGHNIGQWPVQASEEFDGPLPPITKLLLAADQRAAAALETLGADFDFFDVNPDDPAQLKAAGEIIWATKRLLYDISVQGQAALRSRLETVLDRQLTKQEFSALTARLSPENLAAITDRWLTRLPAEMPTKMARRGSEPPKSSVSNPPEQDREAARRRVAAGGWLHDETTLSIRYRPTGHADPWVTAWIDIMTEATTGRHSKITKPLLKQMMAPTAAGLCGSCHSVDRMENDRCVVQWFGKHVEDAPSSFTSFSHAPHLTQKQLADCQSCHQINPLANVMASYTADSPTDFQNGFQPLTKQSCAECHTSQAAGDSCMQCHQYHVAPSSAGGRRHE